MFQVTNRHKSNCGVSRVVHVLQSMAKKLGSHFALEISFQTVIYREKPYFDMWHRKMDID